MSGSRATLVVALVLGVLPVLAVPVLAAREGWRPLGERAVVAMRAHDVFTADVPLLGMPSTVGLTGDQGGDGDGSPPGAASSVEVIRHPGPLLFWVLALPERIAGSRPFGISTGVMLVNLASLVACLWAARRRGGRAAVLLLLPVLLALVWSLGRTALIDPWNATAVLLPFLATCFLTWSVASGDSRALPAGALFASFTAQAHVAFLVPVAALGVWAVAGLWLATRASRAVQPEEPPPGWWTARRLVVATGALLVASWAGPLWDEVTGFPGNLSRLAEYAVSSPDEKVPASEIARYVIHSVGIPPLFVRGRVSDGSFHDLGAQAPNPFVLVTALGVAAALGLAAWRARGRRSDTALPVTALVALASVAVTLTRATAQFSETPRYRLQVLLPLGAFVWYALGWALVAEVRRAGERYGAGVRGAARGGEVLALGVAAALVVALLAAPTPSSGIYDRPGDWRLAGTLASEAGAGLDGDATYRLAATGQRAYWGLGYGVTRELLRRGFDVRVSDGDARSFFEGAHAGGEDDAPLLVGPCGEDSRSGMRQVARVDDPPERETWPALAARANDHARSHVTAEGRAAAEAAGGGSSAAGGDAEGDGEADAASAVAALLAGDDLEPPLLAVVVVAGYAEVPTWLVFTLAEAYTKEVTETALCVWAGPAG